MTAALAPSTMVALWAVIAPIVGPVATAATTTGHHHRCHPHPWTHRHPSVGVGAPAGVVAATTATATAMTAALAPSTATALWAVTALTAGHVAVAALRHRQHGHHLCQHGHHYFQYGHRRHQHRRVGVGSRAGVTVSTAATVIVMMAARDPITLPALWAATVSTAGHGAAVQPRRRSRRMVV